MGRESITPTPLAIQMKHSASMGFSGFNVSECRGDSGIWYEDGTSVDNGILEHMGKPYSTWPNVTAVHKCESLSHFRKDGVLVELVKEEQGVGEIPDPELIAAQMSNDEF